MQRLQPNGDMTAAALFSPGPCIMHNQSHLHHLHICTANSYFTLKPCSNPSQDSSASQDLLHCCNSHDSLYAQLSACHSNHRLCHRSHHNRIAYSATGGCPDASNLPLSALRTQHMQSPGRDAGATAVCDCCRWQVVIHTSAIGCQPQQQVLATLLIGVGVICTL